MGSMAWSARELATEQRRSMISSEGTGRTKREEKDLTSMRKGEEGRGQEVN